MGLEVFGIADLLLVAGHVAQATGGTASPPSVAVEVIGLGGRTVRAAGGIGVVTRAPRGRYDLLVVPGLEVSRPTQWAARLGTLQPELAFIRRTFARGTPVASICIGAYLLAEAGLLQGREATTAWLMAGDFARRYPDVRLRPDALLVEDGAVITSGAITASFDLALHLVRRLLGAEVASVTARIALLDRQRASQAPYVDKRLVAPARTGARFSTDVLQWLEQRLQDPYDLARVARAFHVSPRTLLRRVKAQTGASPLTLLQRARVDRAKHLLRTTDWSIARIVEQVGYGDVATFTRLFVREVGETPARHRQR